MAIHGPRPKLRAPYYLLSSISKSNSGIGSFWTDFARVTRPITRQQAFPTTIATVLEIGTPVRRRSDDALFGLLAYEVLALKRTKF